MYRANCMALLKPGCPVQSITKNEALDIIAGFALQEQLPITNDGGRMLALDERTIIDLGEERFLYGEAVVFGMDNRCKPCPLSPKDFAAAADWANAHTVTLWADGTEFPAYRLSALA